ncbi:MAG: response regulator [Aestuariivirgaceae bacterium]
MQHLSSVEMRQCLVIGRNDEDRQKLVRLLTAYGFELAIAEDAQQAIAISRTQPADLVVMPETINDMDSFDLIRRLRRSDRKAPKVLVYADRPEAGIIGRAIWGGASECFVKPFDASIIELKLRQVGAVQPRP